MPSQQIQDIEAKITQILKSAHQLKQTVKILKAIPGVGVTTAAALIALMPELGALNRRQAASLAGLAPHPNQSGGADAYRSVRGGRAEIKRVLFMAALSAAKHHPTLSIFYKKLIANGKKKLVALTAV